MANPPEQSPREWYALAVRAYADSHQACAWCGQPHQVYRAKRGTRLEYYCPGCDFYTFHDPENDQYFAAPGCWELLHDHESTSQMTTV